MTRYDELASKLNNVDEAKRGFILSLLKDFVFLEEQIAILQKPSVPKYVIDPNKPTRQIKLPAHDILKDYQAQKSDITTKILRSLDNEVLEESPLLKALAEFND